VALHRRSLLLCLLVLLTLTGGAWVWGTWRSNDPAASFQRGLAAVKSRDIVALHREILILRRFPLYIHQMELLRGAVLLSGGDYAAALKEFSACQREPQTQLLALTLAGETLCRLDRQEEAIKVLERAASLDSPSIETYRWLAIAYYDVGNSSRAAKTLRQVIKQDPKDYRPYRLLGMIQRERGRYEEAADEYRACLRLKPQIETLRNQVRFELSDCLTHLSQFQKALDLLDEIPESADTQALRAHCYFGLGNSTKARDAAERAIELDPNHIEGRGWLANLDLEAGNFKAAARNLELIVAIYPTEYAPRKKLSEAYLRLDRKADAEAQLAKSDELEALSLKYSRLLDQVNEKPKDAALCFELAETARQLDRTKLARLWYRATLSLDPKFPDAKQALEKLPKAGSERLHAPRSGPVPKASSTVGW
jgi:tetratricopeptide (TPR) repeat protein